MTDNWKKSSFNALKVLWGERLCPDPSMPALPLAGTESIIKGFYEKLEKPDYVLISCMHHHFQNQDEFRKFAFTTIGEDLVETGRMACSFASHEWEKWIKIVTFGSQYIKENAAQYGYFLDIFPAFPTFETIEPSESYITSIANFLFECNQTRQGLDRPSVRHWLDHGGDNAIKWCLEDLPSRIRCYLEDPGSLQRVDSDAEWHFIIRKTVLAFYGLRGGIFRRKLAWTSQDRITISQDHESVCTIIKQWKLMDQILGNVYWLAQLKYQNGPHEVTSCVMECFDFSRSIRACIASKQI